jgi:hypothetical protein
MVYVTDPNPVAVDLSSNAAGASAKAKHAEVRSRAPIRFFLLRLLGAKTEERAWRVGYKGEKKVGRELRKLPAGWHVVHAVPLSETGTDIDHVVIGPAGVFTLNTKRHPSGRATVYERAVWVNGTQQDYLVKSRVERDRASRRLSRACGLVVPVRSAIVFVDLSSLKEKGRPGDVLVTTKRRLIDELLSAPHALNPAEVAQVHRSAIDRATWLHA